ncbi:hypothetical protein ACFL21_04440 [Patescibacteria group bacterium]
MVRKKKKKALKEDEKGKEKNVTKKDLDSQEEDVQEDTSKQRKIIYVEIDDEITTVYEQIKKSNFKNVYVVVPQRANIFQSIVNLKILKKKADQEKKELHFITNDKNGIYLAKQIGVDVYDRANSDVGSVLFGLEQDEQLKITPLKATVNSIEEDNPTRMSKKKMSIGEILRRKKSKKKILSVSKMDKKAKTKKDLLKKPKLVMVSPNRHALIGLVVISLFILLIIVYIALPGVTIYLTPAASVIEKSVNITLADQNKNKAELDTRPLHMIASHPVDANVKSSITHHSTGKKFSDMATNAGGSITIYNTTNDLWPLVTQTRFQTDEGIVFRILDGITVPAASTEGPGSVIAYVVADPQDAYGVIVGDRGNIAPSSFILPGLREDSQRKIYAESYAPMTGGITDYISYITEEDIEASREILKVKLLEEGVVKLREKVDVASESTDGSIIYQLLEGDGAIKLGDPVIHVPGDLDGTEVTDFTLTGEITVSGVYYEHDSMLEILKSELMLKKSPQKRLLRINDDSTSYRIFEWDDITGKIKLTANIKGIEQFEINPDKESGQRLLDKIRSHISGRDIEDAKVYIQNLPEINKVELDSWPVWAPSIPKITDNIEFEVRDAITVE